MRDKAVLVGRNNDIKMMADFLVDKCGFKPNQIQRFPIKEDKIFFHYQGAGCQVKKRRKNG